MRSCLLAIPSSLAAWRWLTLAWSRAERDEDAIDLAVNFGVRGGASDSGADG